MPVINPTTFIESAGMQFLIMDAPSGENLKLYIALMKEHGVTHLVRTCELSYREDIVKAAGIICLELLFPDGDPPTDKILDEWLVSATIKNSESIEQSIVDASRSLGSCVAIHCVAGLGRAPVLVAMALIERAGFDNLDAIEHVRSRRKGAINRRQLQYLRTHKRRSKKKDTCCSVM